MNRVIKFRVWDSYNKAYLDYPCRFNHLDFNDFFCFDRHFKCDEEKCVVQQFTGLLDKNGKEIYEGDIIKQTCKPGPNLPNWCRGVTAGEPRNKEVKWGDYDDGEYVSNVSCWMLDGESLSELITRTTDKYQEWIREYEVIGNIFENPELLK